MDATTNAEQTFSDFSSDPNSLLPVLPGFALLPLPPWKAVPGALLSFGNFPWKDILWG